jgi:hypothetical protein
MQRLRVFFYSFAAVAGGALLKAYTPEWPRLVIAAFVIGVLGLVITAALGWHAERQERTRAGFLAREPRQRLDRPNIQVANIAVDRRTLIAVGASSPHTWVYVVSLLLKNIPTGSHPDAHANDVLAEIRFVHHGRTALSVSPGRWGDTDQPAVRKAKDPFGSLIDLNAVPFRIGEQHELNVAFKYEKDPYFYGFNNTTYDHLNWENPEFRLTDGSYEVAVRLFGRLVDEEYRFTLKNLGAGGGLTMTPLVVLP